MSEEEEIEENVPAFVRDCGLKRKVGLVREMEFAYFRI